MRLLRVRAGGAVGGFTSGGLVLRRSQLTIQHAQAVQIYGGLVSKGSILVSDGSLLQVFDASVLGNGSFAAGISANNWVRIDSGSTVHLERVTAACAAGLLTLGQNVTVAGQSTLRISDALAFGERGTTVTGKGAGVYTMNGNLHIVDNSSVRIQNARSLDFGAGLFVREMSLANGSELHLRNTSAADAAGGFWADEAVNVSNRSRISISHVASGENAGGFYCASLRVVEQSTVEIAEARAAGQGGGIASLTAQVSGGSVIRVSGARAGSAGGGIFVKESLAVMGSEINIANSSASDGGGLKVGSVELLDRSLLRIAGANASGWGGGFASGPLHVQNSQIHIRHSTADFVGGGFSAEGVWITKGTLLQISDCAAAQDGGGFYAETVHVIENSTVQIDETFAGHAGGGFTASGNVEVHGASLQLSGTRTGGDGGGFNAQRGLQVSGAAQLSITRATADAIGGGFVAGDLLVDASEIVVEHALAGISGGGFSVQGNFWASAVSVKMTNCTAGIDGGGFRARGEVRLRNASDISIAEVRAAGNGGALWVRGGVEVSDSSVYVAGNAGRDGGGLFSHADVRIRRSGVRATGSCAGRGCGFFAGSLLAEDAELNVSWPEEAEAAEALAEGRGGFLRGPLRLERSALHLQRLPGGASALRAQCLAISAESLLSLEASTDVGVSLHNTDCALTCASTLQATGGNVTGTGVSSALLWADACANETIEISGFHLQTHAAAVARTSSHVVLRDTTVDFLGSLDGEVPILLSPSFDAEQLRATCSRCPTGLTFGVSEEGLHALSRPGLRCGEAATLVRGSTERCACEAHQVHDAHFGDNVHVSQTRSYCMDCPRHHEDLQGEECRKCPLLKARRDGWQRRVGNAHKPCTYTNTRINKPEQDNVEAWGLWTAVHLRPGQEVQGSLADSGLTRGPLSPWRWPRPLSCCWAWLPSRFFGRPWRLWTHKCWKGRALSSRCRGPSVGCRSSWPST